MKSWLIYIGFRLSIHAASAHSPCRLIADNHQTVTPFATQTMDQPAGLFMGQTAGFASAIAQNRPALLFQVTRHQTNAAGTPRAPLAAFEFRFALLEKGFDAFVFVFAGKAERE
jgi:hypothetical protein